jgi:hypothetical protein
MAGTRVEKLKTVQGVFAYAAKRYVAKKEDMAEMEHNPGWFLGCDWAQGISQKSSQD